jgi:ribonuclease BN (tRNA processing enzyme)
MKMIFLGSGSGLCSPKENYHSNVLLVDDNKKIPAMAIDCGSHFQHALEDFHINVENIGAIYVTHLHSDHVGGLEWVALKRYFGPNGFSVNGNSYKGPRLIGQAEVLEDLWSKTLAGGLETLQGIPNTLHTFFDVDSLPSNGTFAWNGVVFDIIQTVHTMDNRRLKPSYGLLFRVHGHRVFFTGDTQYCPNQITVFYEEADIIFHDCELATFPGSVHAQFHELSKLPKEFRQKMWLYHYSGNPPEDWQDLEFKGFVQRGQTFEF